MSSKLKRSLEIVVSVPNPHTLFLLPLSHATKKLYRRGKGNTAEGSNMGW